MGQQLLALLPLIFLIPIIYMMYLSHSGNVEVVHVTIPPKSTSKGRFIRGALYAYLLVIVLAVILLPQNGSSKGLLDTLLLIAIAPLPIISIIYLVYFMFSRKDYRFIFNQPGTKRKSVSNNRKLGGYLLFGLIIVYRIITIRDQAKVHGNYAATAIGILFTLYLVSIFVRGLRRNNSN